MPHNKELTQTHLRYWIVMACAGILVIVGLIGFSKLIAPLITITAA